MLKGNSELLTDCGIIAHLAVNTFKDFGHVIGRRKIILFIFPYDRGGRGSAGG